MNFMISFKSGEELSNAINEHIWFAKMIIHDILENPQYVKMVLNNEDLIEFIHENKNILAKKLKFNKYIYRSSYNSIILNEPAFKILIEIIGLDNTEIRNIINNILQIQVFQHVIIQLITDGINPEHHVQNFHFWIFSIHLSEL